MVGLFVMPYTVNPLILLALTVIALPFVALAFRTEWRIKSTRIGVALLVATLLSGSIAWADDGVKADCEYVWWTIECLLWG